MIFSGLLTPSKTEMYNDAFLLHSPEWQFLMFFPVLSRSVGLTDIASRRPVMALGHKNTYHQLSPEHTVCTSDGGQQGEGCL